MRGTFLFTLSTANEEFDGRIEELLLQDQANHPAAYHLERIHVCTGAAEEALHPGAILSWDVRADERGELLDPHGSTNVAHQLSTYLYGKIVENHDDGCSVVFISSGEPAAGVALLQLSQLVVDRLHDLFPIKTHIILLQDQYAFHDSSVSWLMRRLRECSELQHVFYTTMYLLPWDNDESRESSRQTITALVKTMMMGRVDPMMLPGITQPDWIETAAIRKLNAPVERITNVVFKYLADRFSNDVLTPSIHAEEVVAPPRAMQECVRRLEAFINSAEEKDMLPTFEELLCIMPAHDPDPKRKLDEDISAEGAWREIYKIYGDERGKELHDRLNPSSDQMEERYAEFARELSVELLRSVISLARNAEGNPLTSQMLGQIGEKLQARMRERRGVQAELPKYDIAIKPDRREAVAKAKQRHFYLRKVYLAGCNQLATERTRLRAEMVRDAVALAQRYLRDCLTRLENEYRQMCAIFLSRPVERACYADGLSEAYEHWCGRTDAIECLTADELYDQFDDDVLRMDIENAAATVCGRLDALLRQRTVEAVDTIRVKIDRFFSELNFRSELLAQRGLSADLNESLLNFLSGPGVHSPLLCPTAVGEAMCQRARALIFYSEDPGGANAFSELAKDRSIEVVNDPHEKGVQLIVKYAGSALEDVLVYKNNCEEGEIPS